MTIPRVIPVLLMSRGAAVKTARFGEPRYVGDILNAAQILNDKMADELAVLDIDAAREGRGPNDIMGRLAEECFMPLTYGGGVSTLDEATRLFRSGIEKISVNSAFNEKGAFVEEAARTFGSQSIVVSIDAKREADGRYQVYVRGGSKPIGRDPVEQARRAADAGAGEIVIQSIDRDGTRLGYDLELVREVARAVPVPVVALGGAGKMEHLTQAMQAGASAAAAGSLFVFYGRLQAVLITYPTLAERKAAAADAATRIDAGG